MRLLTTSDPDEARAVAQRLDDYNRERQEIEQGVQEAALDQAEKQASGNRPLILVSGEGWHPGVIGIVAGRLRERFDRPACVAGILVNGGGHAMAAGFTVKLERLDDLRDYLATHIERQLDGEVLAPSLGFDGVLSPLAATPELIATLEKAGPFGAGNSRPRFAIPQARVVDSGVVGKGHVRCILTGADGTGRLKAIAFRSADTALGQALLNARGTPLHIAGNLRADEWRGVTSAQLFIDDAALCGAA